MADAMTPAARRLRFSREIEAAMPRLERHAIAVHRLGPRVLLELLLELGAAHDVMPEVAATLAAYASLDPRAVCWVGADRMPSRPLLAVPAA